MTHRTVALLSAVAFVATLAMCAPKPTYTHTADTKFPARAADCEFKVQSTTPNPEEYLELGTINGCQGTSELGRYKTIIQPQVCAAGGDLVVGQVNGYGIYCLGVVFRKK